MKNEKILKEDINFLEYPSWVLNAKSKNQRLVIKKPNGTYELASSLVLPNHFDQLVFYFVLQKLFGETKFESFEIKTTRYDIAKHVIPNQKTLGTNNYNRIMEALKRWKALSIFFKGIFYSGDNYTERYFSKIDDVILDKKTKQLHIRFNQQYVTLLKETNYYKLIDFNIYNDLKRATSRRLYEILCKNFKERGSWSISVELLAEKMAMDKRKSAKSYYPSDVVALLNPAIKEINEKTDLGIQLDYYRSNNVCSFKKIKKNAKIIPAKKAMLSLSEKTIQDKKTETNERVQKSMQYFNALPAEQKVKILEGIERDPIVKINPEFSYQIYAYMDKYKIWQPMD